MTDVGFIGLGIMGRPMAENLMAAGQNLFLHSRSGVPEDLTAAMRLQSQASVLKRFGKPNELWSSPKSGKTFWAYVRDYGVQRNFAFAFQEGHVVEMWVD